MAFEKVEGRASNLFMAVIWFILIIAATSFPWWEYNEFRPQQDGPQNVRYLYVLPPKEVVVGKFVYQEYPLTGKTSFSANLAATLLVTAIGLIFPGMILDLLPGRERLSRILTVATATYNVLSCVVFFLTLSDALWSWPWFMTVFGSSTYNTIPYLYRTSWGMGLGYYLAVVAGVLLLGKAVRAR